MAFKLPFLNKDSDTIEDLKAKGNGLLNTAFGLGPLGFASYHSVRNMKSNNPNFLASLPTNQMGDIHSRVGETFDRYQMVRSQVRQAAKENTMKRFQNVDAFLDKLSQKKVQEKTAFLANLKTILADPNIIDDTGSLMNTVEKLLQETFNKGDIELDSDLNRSNLKSIIKEIIDSETSVSNRASKISSYSTSPFFPVSGLLVKSQELDLSGIAPNLNKLTPSMDRKHYTDTPVFKMLSRAFRDDMPTFVFKEKMERVGSIQANTPYVEIHRDGKRLQTLPLDLSGFAKEGVFPVRYGNMNTMYASSGVFADASALAKIANIKDLGKRTEAVRDLLKPGAGIFMKPEEAIAGMFIRDVSKRGGIGKVSTRDISKINQNIQQSLEFIDRFGYNEDPLGRVGPGTMMEDFLVKKYKQTAHTLKIINPMSLGATERDNLRPLLSQVTSFFDFSANPFASANFGASMGDIGVRTNLLQEIYPTAQLEGLYSSGSGVLETAGDQFGGVLTNRATQPITARFRQMHNRDEFLRNTAINQGIHKPTSIAVLDVLEESRPGQKNIFGLGEGTANYFGETRVMKAINKPVYDPTQYGGPSNILFEELKHRVAKHQSGLKVNRNISIGVNTNTEGKFITEFIGEFTRGGSTVNADEILGNLIREKGLGGVLEVNANKLIYSDINDFFRLFGSKQDNYGIFLGMIDGRRQTIPRYAGLKSMEFGLTEELDSGGRGLRKYSITGYRDTDNPFMKIFSTMFKGTVEKTSKETMEKTLIGRAGMHPALAGKIMDRVGRGLNEGLFTTGGSMLKKSSMNLAEQILSSVEIFERGYSKYTMSGLLENRVLKESGRTLEQFEKLGVKAQSNLTVKAAVQLVAETYGAGDLVLDPQGRKEAIREMGLSYGYFAKALGGGKVEGIGGDEFMNIVRSSFVSKGKNLDEGFYRDLRKEVSKGFAVGFTNAEIGPQSSTLGQSMGSMEPRLYNFLSYKLSQEMGIERNKISDFMFSILSRKKGVGESVELAREYTKTMQSFAKRDLFEENIKRVSVSDFTESSDDIRRFLMKQEGGFLLDFSTDRTLTTRLASEGIPKQIYIPAGEKFLQLLEKEKTLIPTDEAFREIDADYIKSLSRFSKSLMDVSSSQSNAEAIGDALRGVVEFKEAMSEYFGSAFRGTLRGKMAGSTFALGGTVDLGRFSDEFLDQNLIRETDGFRIKPSSAGKYSQKGIDTFSEFASSLAPKTFRKYLNVANNQGEGKAAEIISKFTITHDQMNEYKLKSLGSVNYDDSQKYLMRKIQRTSLGHAVFQDSTSFLNAMNSFMGGVNTQHVMEESIKKGVDPRQAVKTARIKSRKATREMLHHFFLGSYETSSIKDANYAIASRHPIVGSAHVEFVRTFRDLNETASKDDMVFKRFAKTTGGQRALRDFKNLTGYDVSGFKGLLSFLRHGKKDKHFLDDKNILQSLISKNMTSIENIDENLTKSSTLDPEDISEMNQRRLELEEKNIKIQQAIGSGEYDEDMKAYIKKTRDRIKSPKERRKVLRGIFGALSNHMGEVSPGVGGGRLIIPQFMVDVHYGGNKHRMDLSLAGGMIGDFDGDIYQLLYPTRSTLGKKGINLLGDKGRETLEKTAKEKLLYRAKTRVIFELAGEGMASTAKRLAGGTIDRNLPDEIKVKALQEQLAKNVGPIDVSFDALRLGIVNTATESTKRVASDALNMLSAVQEVAVLKAKKLQDALPIAAALSKNINLAIEGKEGAFETVEKLLRHYIFADQDMNVKFGKANVVGGGTDVLTDVLENRQVINLFKPQGLAEDHTTYVMSYLKRVIPHVREAGYLHAKTERRLAAASRQEIHAMHEVFQGLLRENVQGRLMGSDYTDTTMDEIEGAVRRVNNMFKMNAVELGSRGRIGSLGVGLAATMALGSAIGYGGYDPTPLSMEGELVSPELKAAIREGNSFEAGPSQEDVYNMQNSVQNDIMNRQINVGQVIMDGGSNFQVRGEAQNMRSFSELSYIMGMMGGRSHLTINDTRGPISQNYINRKYFGE